MGIVTQSWDRPAKLIVTEQDRLQGMTPHSTNACIDLSGRLDANGSAISDSSGTRAAERWITKRLQADSLDVCWPA
jgi:hypothetical protein